MDYIYDVYICSNAKYYDMDYGCYIYDVWIMDVLYDVWIKDVIYMMYGLWMLYI